MAALRGRVCGDFPAGVERARGWTKARLGAISAVDRIRGSHEVVPPDAALTAPFVGADVAIPGRQGNPGKGIIRVRAPQTRMHRDRPPIGIVG